MTDIVTLRCARAEHHWCPKHDHLRHLCQCQCHACPATGLPCVWVVESPEDYYLATGRRRSDRIERTHCEECGRRPFD